MLKKYDFDKMPIVEIVNDMLVDASKKGASDIHFDPHEDYMKIRIRIDGALQDYAEIPNSVRKNLVTRVKILAGMNITETRLPQDGAIKQTILDTTLDLRVSCLPTINGEKIVIRILDYSMSSQGLESLGFSQSNYEKINRMINLPNGIILVTGATGTGKSTTVYSILQRLNKEDTNIITVEDPIEMNIDGINQVQTNSEIGLTFASALRSILRQDPNVIMIGEIRDTETAKIAVRASITGHIVLSTIHTNNSLNTIERLLDMEVERYLLSSALTGIISQKLARKLCPKCKKEKKTNEYEKDLFKKVLNKNIDTIWVPEGCDECGTGYSGRIAIQEVLFVNQEIKDAISSNMKKEDLRHLVYSSDVTTLLQDGLEKVVQGETSFEEILKLIELDNDDPHENAYDLKASLKATKITQEASEKENEQTIIDDWDLPSFQKEDDKLEKEDNIEEVQQSEDNIEEVQQSEDKIDETIEENIEESDKIVEPSNIEEEVISQENPKEDTIKELEEANEISDIQENDEDFMLRDGITEEQETKKKKTSLFDDDDDDDDLMNMEF